MIPAEELRELFRYDPVTGVIYWKVKRKGGKAQCGGVAGYVSSRGYIKIVNHGKSMLAHRVAFAIYHGRWPEGEIDHVNGVKNDNRICNLREATRKQNNANKGPLKNNLTGYKGVHYMKARNKFVARISIGRRRVFIGAFDSAIEANEAYSRAAKEIHGEFAWEA